MTPLLSKINCPTLVIQGQDDEHASEQHAYDVANHISGSEIWLVPQAGHMLPQDFPDVLNQKLLEFMSVACQKTV
jgi:pimeloyl-ACP methyl ester carboxylesterase